MEIVQHIHTNLDTIFSQYLFNVNSVCKCHAEVCKTTETDPVNGKLDTHFLKSSVSALLIEISSNGLQIPNKAPGETPLASAILRASPKLTFPPV